MVSYLIIFTILNLRSYQIFDKETYLLCLYKLDNSKERVSHCEAVSATDSVTDMSIIHSRDI